MVWAGMTIDWLMCVMRLAANSLQPHLHRHANQLILRHLTGHECLGNSILSSLGGDRFREFLHSIQLMLPVTLKGSCPLVKWSYRLGVGPVQLLTALAAHPNQPHVAQHAQVLGDGRLLQA